MPLHLLGKKSWNVYNTENIARVQRDEATAKALSEEKERDSRNAESSSRLMVLRGEGDVNSVGSNSKATHDRSHVNSDSSDRDVMRKRRRQAGEDDTDRDIRLARLFVDVSKQQRDSKEGSSQTHPQTVSGHHRYEAIALSEQGEEVIGMRFKDAAGYRSNSKPWYNHDQSADNYSYQISKDVWGNDDPRRHEREQRRLVASDPLLAMRKGVRQLKEHERQRQEWREQRDKDLYEVERLARDKSKMSRSRHQGDSDEASLEGFSLDAPTSNSSLKRGRHKDSDYRNRERHHKRRRRSRGPDREDRRHHRHPAERDITS